MGALPKRKVSKGRRDRRRTHDKLKTMALIECDNCAEFKLPHRVCPHCGHYNGREIMSVEDE
jgi:large subunit ribosomal protein L32